MGAHYNLQIGGKPPMDHPRRCQNNKVKRDGLPCEQWARKGSRFCRFHGGNIPRSFKGGTRMRRFYQRRAGSKLRDLLEETAADAEERHTLDGEIDMCRVLTLKALDAFERGCLGDEPASVKTQALVLANLRECIGYTADVVSKSAAARQKATAVVTPQDVQWVVDQIVSVVTKHVPEELADLVVKDIHEIRLPQQGRSADATAEETVEALREMKANLRLA